MKKLKAGKCKSVIKVASFDTKSKFDVDDNEDGKLEGEWKRKKKMRMKSK